MRFSILLLLLLFVNENTCRAATRTEKVLSYCNGFLEKVKATKGRRLYSVADISESSPVYKNPHEAKNFVGEDGYLDRLNQLILKPVRERWAKDTLRNFNVREKPSKILIAPLSFALFAASIGGARHALDHNTVVRSVNYYNSAEGAPFYDFYLKYDYRCRDIREHVAEGDYTQEWGRTLVNNQVAFPYRNYFLTRRLWINGSAAELRKNLSNFPIFIGFKDIIEKGVHPVSGYRIPKEALGSISDEKIVALFHEEDNLAIKFEYISRLIGVPTHIEYEIDPALFTEDLRSGIENDDFNKELMAEQKAGQITFGQLLYGMEAEEARKTQKKIDDDILHFTQLRQNPDLSYSDDPLTPEEVQAAIRTNMYKREH